MKRKTYRCSNCGNVFEVENVMTREEANEKRLQLRAIACPKCGSQNVLLR